MKKLNLAVSKGVDTKLNALIALHQVQLNKLTDEVEVKNYLNKLAFGNKRARAVWKGLFDEQGNYLHKATGYWESCSGCVYSLTNSKWYTQDEQDHIDIISI